MTPENVFEKETWSGSCDPVNLWELNADSSTVAKDMDLKFGAHAPRDIRST